MVERRGMGRRACAAVGLLAVEAGAVAVLAWLGQGGWARVALHDPAGWLAVTPPDVAVAALVRLSALGLGWWLLFTTSLHLLAVATRSTRGLRVTTQLLVPPVRRLLDRAVATSLLVGVAVPVPAMAAASAPAGAPPAAVTGFVPPGLAPPGTTAPMGHGDPVTTRSPPPRPSPRDPIGPPIPATDTVTPPRSPDPPAAGATLHTVRAGEHLWSIARVRLAATRGVPVDRLGSADTTAYWLRVVAANRDRLRSGDPDLVHPGEVVALPDASAALS